MCRARFGWRGSHHPEVIVETITSQDKINDNGKIEVEKTIGTVPALSANSKHSSSA